MPASRNAGPMRLSMPMPPQTFLMSAPDASQTMDRALANDIFMDRNAFDACLINSADARSVKTIGASIGA